MILPSVFEQKLDYIHYNPVRVGLSNNPEDDYYSSARFYHDVTDSFGMLTHYSGNLLWAIAARLLETGGVHKFANTNSGKK